MAAVKTLCEKMAEQGLKSYIVSFRIAYCDEMVYAQFWAEDAGHAGEQADDLDDCEEILLVETQDEWETRTGRLLDYGRRENV